MSECVTNNIDNAFAPLATYLRANKRQAFNTETGGGNTASCVKFLCEQIDFMKQNSDGELPTTFNRGAHSLRSSVFLGYVGWAAGNFATGYVLGETPSNAGGVWTDTSLVASCLAPNANA